MGVYSRVSDAHLLRHELDGLALVFHRPSGLTHMLASPLPEIVAALAEAPVSAEVLLERLSAHYELGADALAELIAHLEELAALGLVRECACATS